MGGIFNLNIFLDTPLRGALKIINEVINMLYTVKEISELAKVTIKTLHYYHKIDLLIPRQVNEAGYRLYGIKELERLQEILFYRELDFSLKEIKQILNGELDRLSILSNQKKLLIIRMKRLENLIKTIDESIRYTTKGEIMDKSDMFKGFETEKEWEDALKEQKQHLKETYSYDLLQNNPINIKTMNDMALEAKCFMDNIADYLKNKVRFDDKRIKKLINDHINFLNSHGHNISSSDYAAQTRFFLNDDFHRNMLEDQQTGLAYYLCMAAETLASENI